MADNAAQAATGAVNGAVADATGAVQSASAQVATAAQPYRPGGTSTYPATATGATYNPVEVATPTGTTPSAPRYR
jgi:hypothetical protein